MLCCFSVLCSRLGQGLEVLIYVEISRIYVQSSKEMWGILEGGVLALQSHKTFPQLETLALVLLWLMLMK